MLQVRIYHFRLFLQLLLRILPLVACMRSNALIECCVFIAILLILVESILLVVPKSANLIFMLTF